MPCPWALHPLPWIYWHSFCGNHIALYYPDFLKYNPRDTAFYLLTCTHCYIYVHMHFWLSWVFPCCTKAFSSCGGRRGTPPLSSWAWASRGGGFSCRGAPALGAQISVSCGTGISVVVAQGLHCSMACGIFLDQGWNPHPLHWQADSYLLYHQGSPTTTFLNILVSRRHIPPLFKRCLSYLQTFIFINLRKSFKFLNIYEVLIAIAFLKF